MRRLLDTHIFLAVIEERTTVLGAGIQRLLAEPAADAFHLSVASLWEIAIKCRLGKLRLTPRLQALPDLVGRLGIELVSINQHHVLAVVEPEPATRDPFDRLLLAQCQVENFRLITADRALVGHPMAVKPMA